MSFLKTEYLILGAGVSGLSAGIFLGNKKKFIILEKENEIGGYCKTIYKDGFVWDYSGHFFHFKKKFIKNLVLSKISKNDIIKIKKKAGILYKKKVIPASFQNNIHHLPKEEFLECLYDLYFKKENRNSNFLDWSYGNLGKAITEKFIKPYNEKLYACSLNKLDVNAMGRFFPVTKLENIFRNFKKKQDQSYNDYFLYPRFGAISYINSLIKGRLNTSRILKNEEIKKIDYKKKIAITNNRKIKYNKIISTIPLNKLLGMARIKYNKKLYNHNKVIVFNFGFNKNFKIKEQWLYVADKNIIFYRVGFYSNIIKQKRGSMYVEIGMPQNKKYNLKDIRKKALKDLKKQKIITNHKLISEHCVVMDPAYLHLSKESIKDSKNKIKYLKSKNIYCCGRYAEWTYCSIEDNIISAQKIISEIKKSNK